MKTNKIRSVAVLYKLPANAMSVEKAIFMTPEEIKDAYKAMKAGTTPAITPLIVEYGTHTIKGCRAATPREIRDAARNG